MNIQKMFLTPNPYSRPRTALKKVRKIAVHYVGNPGSTAKGNRNYFENLKNGGGTYASSHYIVGLEGEIIQCVPEDEISYCTNRANSYSINIECCHPDNTGKFTEATRRSLIELCADLCKRYSLDPLKDIIRHYDITGKKCPLYWVTNPDDFAKFKKEVADIINKEAPKIVKAENITDKKVPKTVKAENTTDKEISETVTVRVNGKEIEAEAVIKDGQTYLKLRSLENAGFKVDFDPETKTRILQNDIKKVPVVFGDTKKYVDSVNIEGSNYCKIRAVAELLGKKAEYDGENIIIK